MANNLPAPGRIVEKSDPDFNRPYHLYIPERSAPESGWPLIISCHGTPPYDSAKRQLDEWKGLAEQKGFLVAAPVLESSVGDFTPDVPEQIRRQLKDEAAILSIVRTVSAAHPVNQSRIFITGWSAGSYPVLFVGLRNPDIFRALATRQGNFNPAFVEPCIPFLDPHQPVQVTYGVLDPLKDDAEACIEWLKRHDMQVLAQERAGIHRRDSEPVYAFFAQVVRHRPMIRVRVHENPRDPMTVSFSVKTSFEPQQFLWDFGDGSERVSSARPEHTYQEADLYNVRVGVWRGDRNKPFVRQIPLQIPRPRLGAAPPARD